MARSSPFEDAAFASLAAVDARSLTPVTDEIGGVVIYVAGEPAYYVLNGEWFAAVPEPGAAGVNPVAGQEAMGWMARVCEIVSTS